MKILGKEVQEFTKGGGEGLYDVRIGDKPGEKGTLECNQEAVDRLIVHTSYYYFSRNPLWEAKQKKKVQESG